MCDSRNTGRNYPYTVISFLNKSFVFYSLLAKVNLFSNCNFLNVVLFIVKPFPALVVEGEGYKIQAQEHQNDKKLFLLNQKSLGRMTFACSLKLVRSPPLH